LELRRLVALQVPPPADDPTGLALSFTNALVISRTVVKRRGMNTQNEKWRGLGIALNHVFKDTEFTIFL
jgi:hypothetical protein